MHDGACDLWNDIAYRSAAGLGYHRSGRGARVLLLHGIPGSAESWRAVAAVLPGTLDVIVPDLIGFGSSERREGLGALHASGQATALDDLLTELDVTKAAVIGHDFGGPVALELMRRRPEVVSALGLFATNTFADTPIPFPLSLLNARVVGGLVGRLMFSRLSLRMMLRQGTGPETTPPDARTYIGDARQQRAIATIFSGSLTRLDELYRPIEDQLQHVAIPVLVGWGDRDPFFSVGQGERTARALGTTLHLYPGAGHFLPHERPQEVAADILTLVAHPSCT